MEEFRGIHNLNLDLPSQVEFNRQKNVTQDTQIANLTSNLNELLQRAPAGFLPRLFYGLTRGNQTYRFTANAVIPLEITGSVGTAFQLYSDNETDNNYIPAVVTKYDDTAIKVVIQGDYNYNSTSFTAVNMTTGTQTTITLSDVLSLQNASYLGDYPAEDNKEKQVTVLNDLENNSKNVVFASLDLNSDGVYNWVEIGNFVDGVDGTSVRAVNSSNYSTVIATVRVNDVLLAGEAFTAEDITFAIGDLYTVDALSPLTLNLAGNIRGAQGVQGETGADGQDGADGNTPYIQDNYWYINGVNTGVKAVGTDGQNGQNGQSFQMQSGLYSTPDNWGQSGNVDGDGNALNQLPTLPQSDITGKGYVVYDPLTTPLAPFYDLYYANNGDINWTIIHPFSGIAGTNGTDGETPYISGGTWWIGSTNTGVAATGPQGPAGPGVPSGGTAGQVLTKIDGTDYNTQWSAGVDTSNFVRLDNTTQTFTSNKKLGINFLQITPRNPAANNNAKVQIGYYSSGVDSDNSYVTITDKNGTKSLSLFPSYFRTGTNLVEYPSGSGTLALTSDIPVYGCTIEVTNANGVTFLACINGRWTEYNTSISLSNCSEIRINNAGGSFDTSLGFVNVDFDFDNPGNHLYVTNNSATVTIISGGGGGN